MMQSWSTYASRNHVLRKDLLRTYLVSVSDDLAPVIDGLYV